MCVCGGGYCSALVDRRMDCIVEIKQLFVKYVNVYQAKECRCYWFGKPLYTEIKQYIGEGQMRVMHMHDNIVYRIWVAFF